VQPVGEVVDEAEQVSGAPANSTATSRSSGGVCGAGSAVLPNTTISAIPRVWHQRSSSPKSAARCSSCSAARGWSSAQAGSSRSAAGGSGRSRMTWASWSPGW
jgi:hypothetical protein